jgi:hypothetical protein
LNKLDGYFYVILRFLDEAQQNNGAFFHSFKRSERGKQVAHGAGRENNCSIAQKFHEPFSKKYPIKKTDQGSVSFS